MSGHGRRASIIDSDGASYYINDLHKCFRYGEGNV